MATSERPPGAVVRLAIRAIGLFFALFALVGVVFFSNNLLSERRVASWPSVQGEVLSASAYHRDRPGRGRGKTHGVNVSYTYDVNATRYTGDRYFLTTNQFSTASGADQAVRTLTPGSATPVFYDPADPSRSCLAHGPASGNWIALAICIVTLLGGLGFVALSSRIKPVPLPDE